MFVTGPHAKEGMRVSIVRHTEALLNETLDSLNKLPYDDPAAVWELLTKLDNEISSLRSSYEYACSVTFSESCTRLSN